MASVLEELSEAITGLASTVAPSVVGVGAGGSGVVVGAGLVVTNAHNLRRDEVMVTDHQGERRPATVAGVDPDGDLAVLSVDTGSAPALPWAERAPEPGEVVVALAHPGGRGVRVSVGVVSAVGVSFPGPGGRRITGALEHTAPLSRGSSGGPVVDAGGRLLGIDTHREGDGLYLAVVADAELRRRVDALAGGEAPRRPRLGVALAPPRVARRLRQSVGLPERTGLLVQAVDAEGPAERAGIRQGDLIVAVGGQPVADIDDLATLVGAADPDGSLQVGLVRGVEERTVSVELGG